MQEDGRIIMYKSNKIQVGWGRCGKGANRIQKIGGKRKRKRRRKRRRKRKGKTDGEEMPNWAWME